MVPSGQIRALDRSEWPAGASLSDSDIDALHQARHADPFAVLGCHSWGAGAAMPARWVVRIWHRSLERDWETEGKQVLIRLRPLGASEAATVLAPTRRCPWLYEAVLEGLPQGACLEALGETPWIYEVEITDGNVCHRIFDAYALGRAPLLTEEEVDQFQSGIFPGVADTLGCHVLKGPGGVVGLALAVWAPNAAAVSVVGDWNGWDGRACPMRRICRSTGGGFTGLWELFLPFGPSLGDVPLGNHYGYQIRTPHGDSSVRIDPFAQEFEAPPHDLTSAPHTCSSKVSTCDDAFRENPYSWGDEAWMRERERLGRCGLITQQPMSIYEAHLPSWRRTEQGGFLSYRDLAPLLVQHLQNLNFTHVELIGLAHHPYYGSWGYQVAGYYACYSLLGSPDDFKFLVDTLHRGGIGVIMDFVPAHFCKDACSFASFDGTPTFEYEDPREGEQKDWGTKVFNFRKNEVRSFLLGSVLFWAERYHVDGFRFDAVSSMLYRNFCSTEGFKREGEWIKNEHGGNANLEAISFLRDLNRVVHQRHPGVVTIAEESHAWGGVTWEESDHHGGLGFDLKWDMGWMNDTLTYLELAPTSRPSRHGKLTCRQLHAERWVCPLSHDEVTHSKGSLVEKMGKHGGMEFYDRLRLLSALVGYQVGSVGRPLLFMGSEFAQGSEWKCRQSLDWHEGEQPPRRQFCTWLSDLLAVYRHHPPLHAGDAGRGLGASDDSFEWVESNKDACVLAFVRRWRRERPVLVIVNFGSQEHRNYTFCAPHYGEWEVLLNSDDGRYGGRGAGPGNLARVRTSQGGREGWSDSLSLDMPGPGCVLLLGPERPDDCRASGSQGHLNGVAGTLKNGRETDENMYCDDAWEYGCSDGAMGM